MSETIYRSLLDEFCLLLPAEEAATLKETGRLKYDGVNFRLVYFLPASADTVYLMCDIGLYGTDNEAGSHRRMLEVNYCMAFPLSPLMAVDPSTGMQVFITRLPLEQLTSEGLMTSIHANVGFVEQWRKGEFQEAPAMQEE